MAGICLDAGMTDLWLFSTSVALLLAMPGPTNTLLAVAGATADARRLLSLLAAVIGGYAVAISVLRIGLAPLVQAAPVLASLARLVVAAVLIRAAIKLWHRDIAADAANGPATPTVVFTTTALNPKALVLAFGLLPFEHGLPVLHLVVATALGLASALLWIGIGATIDRRLRHHSPRLVPRIGAGVLTAFAGLIGASAFV